MDETATGLAEELRFLFELSLTVNQTLDPHAISRDFLRVLTSGRNLDGASIWWLDPDSAGLPANELVLLDAIPRDRTLPDRRSLSHPIWQLTRDGREKSFAAEDKEFASLVSETKVNSRACVLFPLEDQGVLVLHSESSTTLSPRMLEQLRRVVARLATGIKGGMAQPRLGQSDAALRDMARLLAEEQRRSEQFAAQFAETLSQRQTLIHTLPDLVWLKNPEGVYLACNNRFERFFGAQEKDIVGKTDYDFVPRELAESFRKQDGLAEEKGSPSFNEEWITFADDGHRELLETTKTPMFDTTGRLIGILGIGHDITERKRIEETRRANEVSSRNKASMLRMMCDNVPDMIWAKALDKRYLFANKAICEQFLSAVDIKEPKGKTEMFFAERERNSHPDNPDWHTFGLLDEDSDAITLERGKPSVFEESGYIKGKFLCLEIHKSPFFNDKGEIIGTVGSARDITDRKKIEAELEQYRQHLEDLVQQRSNALIETEAKASLLLQSSADGLYGVDTQGFITFINPAACKILGYSAEEVIGHNAHELFHPKRADHTAFPAEECPGRHALLTGREIRVDNQDYWHSDGHTVPVMYAMHPIFQNGKNTGAVVSFVDISEQRAAAQAREQALIAAEHLARVKSEFLANMSHEIRTPLNGVLGFAQIGYRNYQDSGAALNAFDKILTSGNRLLGVVNDILDFSKLEAGKLSIDRTEVSLGEVIDHAVALVGDRAYAKRIDLKVEKASNLPRTCISDPLRIGQILLNLLSNAVKFTEVGSVTLSASRQGSELVFQVTDTGVGIDDEQAARLFNPFQQADGSSTRRFGGTGLGLAICKQILELMDGRIGVESQPGVGSTFEVRLPFVESTTPSPQPGFGDMAKAAPPEQPLSGISILVAEDDAINQMVIEHNLIEDGASVVMVGNGRDAVERLIHDGPDAFDIVLMDVQMPEMDGYEATRLILEQAPGLPVIGQTAHVLGDEREKCFAAGMVEHIAKPIDPDQLVKIVLQFVSSGNNG
jgi:PAS domain S-box-containing protein